MNAPMGSNAQMPANWAFLQILAQSHKMLFPAESVFGSIEVKSRLDGAELRIAIDNIASLNDSRGWTQT